MRRRDATRWVHIRCYRSEFAFDKMRRDISFDPAVTFRLDHAATYARGQARATGLGLRSDYQGYRPMAFRFHSSQARS